MEDILSEIDLAPLFSDNNSIINMQNIAYQMIDKFSAYGFIHLKNHNIPNKLIQAIFNQSRIFHGDRVQGNYGLGKRGGTA